MAIIGFIGAALMAIMAVPMLMGSAMMGNLEGLEGTDADQLGMMAGAGVMIGLGVVYLVSAAIYFMASLYLLRYAGSIKRAVASLGVADLEAALDQQASFWKLVGIMTLIFIVLMLVLFVGGVGGAIFMGGAGV